MDEKSGDRTGAKNAADTEARLMRIAKMFGPHRNDPIMRELCRLAIKCVQEGWADG